MAEYQFVSELLQTGIGTEGSLLIPRKILPVLITESEKFLIPRELAAKYLGPGDIPGSSIDINRHIEDTLMVRLVSEGAEVPLDNQEYNNLNVRPRKFGVAVRITREMMEDSTFNLLDDNVMMAGRKFGENETDLVIDNALQAGANTVTGGAAITIANVTRAMQYLEEANKMPTDFVVGLEVLNDLRNIDTFVEFQKIGNTDMLQRGFTGNLYGMNVARVFTAINGIGATATTAYVLDRRHAYVIAEKRPLTVERFDLPTFDMSGVVLTQRIDVQPLRTNAIAIITTT